MAQILRRSIFIGICKCQFPIWKGVKQNERNHRHYSYICGGYAVFVHPGRGSGGQAEGEKITENMLLTGRVTVSTVISGKGSGKDAARRNAITFFRKEKRHQQMFQEILCHSNLAKMVLAPVKAVHTADIPHVSAIAYRRFCMK